MKRLLSRYSFTYPRSIVYMLQACEYEVGHYLHWYWRVKDFRHVEHRKSFIPTAKALVLLCAAWAILLLVVGLATLAFWYSFIAGIVAVVVAVLVAPFLLAYGITLPLILLRIFIQSPAELLITRRARKRLAGMNATKIAIAGSFGKTSMRDMLATTLAQGKKVAAPPHSYNTPLAISRFINSLDGDEDIIVFELGEYRRGDVKSLCDLVQPNMGVITGVNEAHLEKLKTLQTAAETIYELADYLGDKPTYVNAESPVAAKYAKPNHKMYSRKRAAGREISHTTTSLDGTSFRILVAGERLKLHSRLLGLHQVGPLAAVVDIALGFGLTAKQIVQGIESIEPFKHRLEPRKDGHGVITLDDSYNGNPDGVRAVIDFLATLKDHRRWYVTPGLVEMGSQTEKVHKQIGAWLTAAKIEKVVLVKNSVTGFISDGLKSSGYKGEVLWFDDALQAFAALPHLTVSGDVVLLQNDWPDQYQ